jgi:hypothetical protein
MNPQTPTPNSVDALVCPFAPAKSNQQQVLNLASVSRNLATLFAAAAFPTETTAHSTSATYPLNRG